MEVGRHKQMRLIAEGYAREKNPERTAVERLTLEHIESDGRFFSRRSDSQERFLTIAEKSESIELTVNNRELKI